MQAKCAGEFGVGKLCCVLCNFSLQKTSGQVPEQGEISAGFVGLRCWGIFVVI